MHRSAHLSGWADLLLRWTLHLVAADRTHQTIETRTEHIRRISRAFPDGPHTLTPAAWEQWSGRQRWATETRRSYTASVRSFFAWYNGSDPTASVPRIRPSQPSPRPIPDPVLLDCLARSDSRTALILRLAAEAGLRRAEIAGLHSGDLSLGQPPTLAILGKGRRPRTVPIPQPLADELSRREPGWVFPSRAGHLTPRHVSALAARVLPAPWTLHTLRHRFAARAYESRDLLAVQRLLGHASPATTQRYVPTSMQELLAAAQLAHLDGNEPEASPPAAVDSPPRFR